MTNYIDIGSSFLIIITSILIIFRFIIKKSRATLILFFAFMFLSISTIYNLLEHFKPQPHYGQIEVLFEILFIPTLILAIQISYINKELSLRKESEKKFRHIAENTPMMIFRIDNNSENNFSYLNPYISKITGFSREEFSNDPYLLIKRVIPEDQGKLQEAKKLLNGEPFILRSLDKNNKMIWTEQRQIQIYDEDGNPDHILGSAVDITELMNIKKDLEFHKNNLENLVLKKTLEIETTMEEWRATSEELYEKNEIIEKQNVTLQKTLKDLKSAQKQLIHAEKMASIGFLSAGIAHEVNNPINYINGGILGIKNALEIIYSALRNYDKILLKNNILIDPKVEFPNLDEAITISEKMLKNIQTGIEKTVNIINSMRVFSKSSEDTYQFYDLNNCIDSSLTLLYNQYKGKIKIEKQLCDKAEIKCIPEKAHQIVMNLLINAIQSIKETGEIQICTSWDSEKKILILSIKDSGEGIAKKIRKNIFDPFFTTKEVGQGTGLGLYLTYSFVKIHGGDIRFHTKEGKGTEFIVELPKNKG